MPEVKGQCFPFMIWDACHWVQYIDWARVSQLPNQEILGDARQLSTSTLCFLSQLFSVFLESVNCDLRSDPPVPKTTVFAFLNEMMWSCTLLYVFKWSPNFHNQHPPLRCGDAVYFGFACQEFKLSFSLMGERSEEWLEEVRCPWDSERQRSSFQLP